MPVGKLNAAFVIIFGAYGFVGGGAEAMADSLNGSYAIPGVDLDSPNVTFSASGSDLNADGAFGGPTAVPFFVFGLGSYPSYAGFTGSTSQGVLSALAAAGGHSTYAGSAQSSISYSTTITNTGQSAQDFQFNFSIAGSLLQAAPDAATPTTAQIGALIQVNGASVWSSGATLFGNDFNNTPSFSVSTTGSAFLSYTTTDGAAFFQSAEILNFDPFAGVLDLGTLASGQSETLTYTLSAQTLFPKTADDSDYGGGVAEIGNPNLGGSFSVTTTPVPELDSVAMMAAGLTLLGALARRRR